MNMSIYTYIDLKSSTKSVKNVFWPSLASPDHFRVKKLESSVPNYGRCGYTNATCPQLAKNSQNT